MSKSLVITLIGDDRPGIVESVSEIIVKHHGEWVESRMANLSGKFAGILRVVLPNEEFDTFSHDLESGTQGLSLNIELADTSGAVPQGQCYKLELVGQDQPGIVHRIASVLKQQGATVEEMNSEINDASMSGERLFKADITLCLPSDKNIDELGDVLEDLANELIVDIELG